MDENKRSLVNRVNEKLKPEIGYNPYFVDDNDRVRCYCCHREVTTLEEDKLQKTRLVQNSDGDEKPVHACPGCNYLQGVNVSLKKRITDIRKELDLREFPTGKFKNDFFIPKDSYIFLIPESGEAVDLTEEDLYKGLREFRENITKPPREVVSEVTEGANTETTSSASDEDVDVDESDDKDIEEEVEDNASSEDTETSTDGENVEDEIEKEDEEEEENFFDNEEDLDELFGTENQSLNEEESEDNSDKEEEEEEVSESDSEEEEGLVSDEDLDDFFERSTQEQESSTTSKANTNNNFTPSGISDVKVERDSQIDDMVKQNKEYEEDEVFRTSDRKDHVYNVIHKSRVSDLTESFIDSEAKVVVDRILALFEKRAGKKLAHKLTISEMTHECPVVDFEGNIRLIFVDLDYPTGKYNIESEVNKRLRPPFANTSEYEMMTFVIYSDMIERRYLNRVVRAVSKNIAFNLKIKGIFSPISIISDSDQYFYTTSEYDKKTITRFDMANCAGNVDKPHNGEVALVSYWNNPNLDDTWKYRKELQNRANLARGGDIDYDDLSMYMTCSIKYIQLPQKPDGTINVTIVEYIESLDLFVKDGFGALIGVLLHNIKTKHPQSKVFLYYELDMSMIPSPTISRYIKMGAIRPVSVNPEFVKLNNIISTVAKQNRAQDVSKIPVEGEPFDSPEYNNPYWRSYMLLPEYRRNAADAKRVDWRRYGKRAFAKTLGDRFKEYRNINVNSREQRQAVLEKLGYYTVIQPPIVKARVVDNFAMKALMAVMNSCSGIFSIEQYIKAKRTSVVDDNYMNSQQQNVFTSPQGQGIYPNTGAAGYGYPNQEQQFSGQGYNMTPQQYQQWMMMNQMRGGWGQ